jgi:hypothetical protein
MLHVDVSPNLVNVIEEAILRSFESRPMRGGITQAEVKRRFEICERIWKVLRIEHKWSVQRVCDHLYRFLLQEIDGISWEPNRRVLWVPDGMRQRGPGRTCS